jgi:hypothetical protein
MTETANVLKGDVIAELRVGGVVLVFKLCFVVKGAGTVSEIVGPLHVRTFLWREPCGTAAVCRGPTLQNTTTQ